MCRAAAEEEAAFSTTAAAAVFSSLRTSPQSDNLHKINYFSPRKIIIYRPFLLCGATKMFVKQEFIVVVRQAYLTQKIGRDFILLRLTGIFVLFIDRQEPTLNKACSKKEGLSNPFFCALVLIVATCILWQAST